MTSRVFWASKPAEEYAQDVNVKIHRYYEAMNQLGLIERLRAQYRLYYMRDLETGKDTSMLDVGTRKSPKVTLQLPEFRQNIRKQLAFIRQEKISFSVVSDVGGQRSIVGSEFGEKALNYLYEQNIAPEIYAFAEKAFVYAAAATHLRWNIHKGDDIQVPETVPGPDGNPVMATRFDEQQLRVVPIYKRTKSGAPYVDSLDPTMFAMDPVVGTKANWVVAFERTNVFALAAAFENDEVLDCATYDMFEQYRLNDSLRDYGKNDGDVMATHVYYADSPELPDGRHTVMVGDKVIYDVPRCPLRSGRLPVRVLSTSQFTDNALSFGDSFGLAAIDQALTKIRSTEATNAARQGRTRLWRGQAVRPDTDEAQSDELTVYVGGDAAPEYIQPPAPSPVLATLKQDLIEASTRLSGFSPISAGQASTTSGAHVREYEHITQRNLSLPSSQLLEHETALANDALELVKANASLGFIAEIAGPDGNSAAQMFTPDDVSTIRRVTAKAMPDAARGALARIGLVDLISKIPDPLEQKKAWAFILRGDDQYGKGSDSTLNLIELENERLITGDVPTFAVATQNQQQHLWEHAHALDRYMQSENPDPSVIVRFNEHMMKHTDLIRVQDPIMNDALQLPPPPVLPGTPAFMMQAQLIQAQAMLQPMPMPMEQEPPNA